MEQKGFGIDNFAGIQNQNVEEHIPHSDGIEIEFGVEVEQIVGQRIHY